MYIAVYMYTLVVIAWRPWKALRVSGASLAIPGTSLGGLEASLGVGVSSANSFVMYTTADLLSKEMAEFGQRSFKTLDFLSPWALSRKT